VCLSHYPRTTLLSIITFAGSAFAYPSQTYLYAGEYWPSSLANLCSSLLSWSNAERLSASDLQHPSGHLSELCEGLEDIQEARKNGYSWFNRRVLKLEEPFLAFYFLRQTLNRWNLEVVIYRNRGVVDDSTTMKETYVLCNLAGLQRSIS